MMIKSDQYKEEQITYYGIIHGIIWFYNNREKADKKLNKIIEDYSQIGITAAHIRKTSHEYSVQFKNGDRWEIKNAKESSRSSKCNISLVDSEIPLDVFNIIIRPYTIAKPFCAIDFY